VTRRIVLLLFLFLPQLFFSAEIQGRIVALCDRGPIIFLNNGLAEPVRLHDIDCLEKIEIGVLGPSSSPRIFVLKKT
jgi:hypothetical protein